MAHTYPRSRGNHKPFVYVALLLLAAVVLFVMLAVVPRHREPRAPLTAPKTTPAMAP